MALNYVILTLDRFDGSGNALAQGTASLIPSVQLLDTVNEEIIDQVPVVGDFQASRPPRVKLVASDNATLQPNGADGQWTWDISFAGVPGNPPPWSFLVNFAGGAEQNLSDLAFVVPVPAVISCLPLQYPHGAAAGYVWTTDADGNGSWQASALAAAESFATAAVSAETSRAETAEALKAPLASPALTGTPTAPTQAAGDSSTKIATGAFVAAAVPGWTVAPSGDTTGAADTAAIQALENLGARVIYLAAGTFWTTGLVKQASTIWQGSGRYQTIIKLAAGADADVIQGANFATLTLSGSTAGIGGWGIRDLTVNGNKAAQSGTSWGIRVYGYNFDLTNVSVINGLAGDLYTEWGDFGAPGLDSAMEARYYGLKLSGSSGYGWRNRGPHDSRIFDVTSFSNGSGFPNYWTETNAGVGVTVASGSNGASVSSYAGSGTLNVTTTLGYPAASISSTQGSLTVTTSSGQAVITYTGITATSFTGCTTVSGTGTLSAGGAVNPTGIGYSANGCLLFGVHGYGGSASYQFLLDAQQHLTDCISEVAATASTLVRANFCQILGGQTFIVPGATQTGCGIQLGDTANPAFGEVIRTWISGYACTSAATAGLNFAADAGQNDIDVAIYAGTGTVFYGGTPNGASADYKIRAYGQAVAVNSAGSLWRERAEFMLNVPNTVTTAFNVTQNGSDLLNINTSSKRAEFPNGYLTRWYTDNYGTPVLDIDATKAHVVARSGSSASLAPSIAAGAECSVAALGANSSDTAGSITATMVASPGGGALVTVTFNHAFTNHASVVLFPTTVAAALISSLVYVQVFGSAFTLQVASPVPAGADSAALGWNYLVIGQDA